MLNKITHLDVTKEGSTNEEALTEGYQGFISLNVRKPSGPEWQTFATAVANNLSSFDSTAPPLTADEVCHYLLDMIMVL